jgi:hypothetical protein
LKASEKGVDEGKKKREWEGEAQIEEKKTNQYTVCDVHHRIFKESKAILWVF